MSDDPKDTLTEREKTYGAFGDVAATAVALKNALTDGVTSRDCSDVQREALSMIATKMARIVNGDPDYVDSWHDIAGYALLAIANIEARAEPDKGGTAADWADFVPRTRGL